VKKKFLVVIDESKELKNAIHFAAQRAKNTNGSLSMLYVIDHAINAQWSKVENLIEQEETSEAKKICRSWAQKIKEKFSIDTEIILKLGNRTDELVKLLKEDKDIRFLVLATSDEGESPGPIIKSLMSAKIKELSIPAVLVPGSIEEKDIDLIV
jgi:nucleotide-binding universal stress UspA family protein|tara:strand:+ start:306 stop:767 length:462 start_codon:yes stop_codon:yes gene_type:complete